MPDKNYTRCGSDCLRCWRNRMKHANKNSTSASNPTIIYPEKEISTFEAKIAKKNTIEERKKLKLQKQKEKREERKLRRIEKFMQNDFSSEDE